jgi:hypothetical protein
MNATHDMCPICVEPFKKGEVLVRYVKCGEDQPAEKLGHLDCALYLSNTEDRKHPPTQDKRISELEKTLSNAIAQLGKRITLLGG